MFLSYRKGRPEGSSSFPPALTGNMEDSPMPQADSRSTTPKISLPKSLPLGARKLVERAIDAHLSATEALTAFLDAADQDPDLESTLGAVAYNDLRLIDCEEDVVDRPHDEDAEGDLEPALSGVRAYETELGF
jgi:hypothetical protein